MVIGFRAPVDTRRNAKKTDIPALHADRHVECNSLKKAVQALYSEFLAKKSYPFVYLSLKIDPACVDVNAHPTKREVCMQSPEAFPRSF